MALWPLVSRASLQSSGPSATDRKNQTPDTVPGEILVRFRKEAAAAKGIRAELTVSESGRQIPVEFERLSGIEMIVGLRLARVAPEDTAAAINGLKARPDVVYAEPNFIRHKEATPNDPRYGEQWALKNTGQPSGLAGADIKAEQAWDLTTGSRNVVVGVVDEGIDINHPDLKDNIWSNPAEIPGNGIDDDGNGYVDDLNGWDFSHNDNTVFDGNGSYPADQTDAHGTHVAGTIGATGNNAVGIAGVNWQASLLSLKFLGPDGGSTADLVKALSYAKMMRDLWTSSGGTKGANVRVLNNSYGGLGFSQAELDAVRALADSNILFVAAAGNDGVSNDYIPHYPANYDAPNVISVAASDRNDFVDFSSDYGIRTVTMTAPGIQILSTTPNATYSTFSGTSMASPHVAGTAALICAANPAVTLDRLRADVIFNGDQLSAGRTTITGRRLNAANALQAAAENDTTPPATVADFHVVSQTGEFTTLQWTAPGDDGNGGRAALYEIRFSDGDLTNPTAFAQARTLITLWPQVQGSAEYVVVRIPYRHSAGFIGLRTIDNVGNASAIASVAVADDPVIADPYTVTEGAPSQLSSGGTALGLKGDDKSTSYQLPFEFRFFGITRNSIEISTNGAIYFSVAPDFVGAPRFPNGQLADISSVASLNRLGMIAGLWDDLRTDRRAGDDVYVVTPDHSRIIFRWQGVTFDRTAFGIARGENPVSFEIELNRDGTIQTRYGDGNHNVAPVVGISAGPDSYLITSHTSETALTDLANAATVNFALKNPPPPPAADLQLTMTDSPDPVFAGQLLTYAIDFVSVGQQPTYDVVLTDSLPLGTTFVQCQSTFVAVSCTGPPPGTNGTVTARMNELAQFSHIQLSITVRVTADVGTLLSNTASVTSLWTDPNSANNSATATTLVIAETLFSGVTSMAVGSFAVRADGALWAWGGYGDAGASNPTLKLTPVQLSQISDVSGVSASDTHVMILKNDGTLWGWGQNSEGELGVGNDYSVAGITQVIGVSNVEAAATGTGSTIILRQDGTVWAWGSNFYGQLGNGTTDPSLRQTFATQVINLSGIEAIAAAGYHMLALKNDGTVWAWGSNFSGESGIDLATRQTGTPHQISGLTGVKAIAAGTCSLALKTDGTVWGFGAITGNGTSGSTIVPIRIGTFSDVKAIGGGANRVTVLKLDGTVWNAGSNDVGQLGDGTTTGKAFFVQVSGLSGVKAIAASGNTTLALMNDTTLRGWGANTYGVLGDDSLVNRQLPVAVSGVLNVSNPTINPDGGMFNTPVRPAINCITPGAVIHYTTNGVDPTEADPTVEGGSLILENYTTLRLKAFKDGWRSSDMHASTFYVFPPANQIDAARFFVTQHYHDFLNREPDPGGLDYWSGQILQCGNDLACIQNRRLDVSAAFFIELEFQQTGYVVYRMNRAAYGTIPDAPTRANINYSQFNADRSLLVAGSGLAQSTIDLANAFVQRSAFKTEYPDTLSNGEFVNHLFDRASLTGSANAVLRQTAVDAMSGGRTRAQVLLDVIDIQEFKDREYKPAFVLMQYFGYLRRDPDQGGYDFWLNILNNKLPNDSSGYRAMVCAFITSGEYQLRFGSQITHTDHDCSQ